MVLLFAGSVIIERVIAAEFASGLMVTVGSGGVKVIVKGEADNWLI